MDKADTYMAVCVMCLFAAMVLHDRGMVCVPVALGMAAAVAATRAVKAMRDGR